MTSTAKISRVILAACVFAASVTSVLSQGSYRAQVRGTIADSSGAVIRGARVTITEIGTNVATSDQTNDKGEYYFTGLRPSTYSVKAEAQGFRAQEKTGVVLAVDQQTTLNFTMNPGALTTAVEVNTTAPLLDTESPTLGTEVSNQYIKDIPLPGRDFFGLTFLSGGVTETAGSGTTDNYPTGTNFVSNGQRNATAEVRIDGSLISAPEQGEGATSNVYYEPSVEVIQEFKIQNNSFSAEFGNNGGTVVNMALKSGTNNFHGSGWWFGQRAGTDARDFFNPGPKPGHVRDQYGFSIGGPIQRNKTFFFGDIEKVRSDGAVNIVASVPTDGSFGMPNERAGDFRGTANPIYDPIICSKTTPPDCSTRPQVGLQAGGTPNVIPQNEIDPVGQAIINLYPKPNLPGEFNNFRANTLATSPDYQFDIKLDHQFTDKNRLSGRYSRLSSRFSVPTFLGDGDTANEGIAGDAVKAQNASLEYAWTITPKVVWTSHFAVDRVTEAVTENYPDLTSVGFPAYLAQNGLHRMPTIQMSSSGSGSWSNLFDQCCTDTTFAHTLYSYSSQLLIAKGPHLLKFGGEQRIFFNNFFQPPNPTGLFNFTDDVTSDSPNSGAEGGTQGNPFASLLFGYPDNSSVINIFPAVANKSKETGLYFQDDWKVNSRLTLNLGLRYEWSTPYTERFNHTQFSDFTGNSGMNIDLSSGNQPALDANGNPLNFSLQALGLGPKQLIGTTLFPNTFGRRTVPVDRNNWGPRLGFAYQLDQNTVVRGGAGVYYGMSVATNFQYPGTAFRKSATMFFTTDNFNTRTVNGTPVSLSNPFPNSNNQGPTPPQGQTYGKLAEWGFANGNDLGTSQAQNADIYQWNLGIQRLLPSQIVIGVDYSANRSNHLPFGGYSSTRNRDFISSALLAKLIKDPNFLAIGGTGSPSDSLFTPEPNPFCTSFSGGANCLYNGGPPIFNEPDSQYGNPTLPLANLLRPYPQFDGDFEGLPRLVANSWYNSMQIRFQKRTTHHISFEGNYTISKLTDNSSTGANAFVGTLNNGNPQQLDNLKAEHSISANDTPQRLAAAVIFDLPVGRDRWIGSGMNRVLDAIIGGWSVSTLITEQSGQPMSIYMSNSRLLDGNQRPNVLCGGRMGVSANTAAIQQVPFLNANCFADPGDQVPGNAPRYFPGLRTDGIHNLDSNLFKEFVPREGMTLQLRAEVFNTFNTPRFATPDTFVGDDTFGIVNSTAAGYTPRGIQWGVRFEF
jgi:hypothetical protein